MPVVDKRPVFEPDCFPQPRPGQCLAKLLHRQLVHLVQQRPHQQSCSVIVVRKRLARPLLQSVARCLAQQVPECDIPVLGSQIRIQLLQDRQIPHNPIIQRSEPALFHRLQCQKGIERLPRGCHISAACNPPPRMNHLPALNHASAPAHSPGKCLQPGLGKTSRLRRLPFPFLPGTSPRPASPPVASPGRQGQGQNPQATYPPHSPALPSAFHSASILMGQAPGLIRRFALPANTA